MHTVVLDTRGQLVQFNSVPPQFDATPPAGTGTPPWPSMLQAAGLEIANFSAATPQWSPRDFADARAAFEGPLPAEPTLRVRVEAASYREQPVAFALVGPWSRPTRMQPLQRSTIDRVAQTIFTLLALVLVAGAGVLARHNLRVGRADRRGATRVVLFILACQCVAWVVANHHVPDVRAEVGSFTAILGDALFVSTILWIMYVALEPYCRRFWPDMLLGWSRLLSGRIRDPRVGRDVLIGLSFGVLWLLLDFSRRIAPTLLGYASLPRLGYDVNTLLGAADTIFVWILIMLRQLAQSLSFVLMFVVLRLITGRAWAAIPIGMFILLIWWSDFGGAQSFWLELALEIAMVMVFTTVVIRFGLLPAVIAMTVAKVVPAIPLTLQFSHWSATASNMTLLGILMLALFGFYASRSGRPLFGRLERLG